MQLQEVSSRSYLEAPLGDKMSVVFCLYLLVRVFKVHLREAQLTSMEVPQDRLWVDQYR